MKSRLCGCFAAIFFSSVFSASAALISPIAATTTMGSGSATNLINTINGDGLSSLSLTASHDATTPLNSWVSGGGVLTGEITFDLGGVFSIQGFSFWNQNDGGPGVLGAPGIQDVVVSSSLDNINFTPVLGSPTTFAQESNLVSSAQQFSFTAVDAGFVKFTVLSNHGDPNQTGFAEVQFDQAVSVPDGSSTLALFGTLLLGFAAVRHGKLHS